MQGKKRKGGWCPTLAPLGFPLGSLWPSEVCHSCLWPVYPPPGLVLPAHLPTSSSCSALGPCVRSPTQVCLRRAAVSVLAAMWCGPISDHSFFSVPPYFQVSDTWRGPGTTCVTSSWEILVSPVKLFAQEESWSLASMQGSLVLGCIRGRWASCKSDRAAQESNSASQVGLAQCQASEWMRRGHHGV